MTDLQVHPPTSASAGGDAALATFVALSAVLTGFDSSVLLPRTDAQGQAAQYLAFLQGPDSGVAAELPGLLAQFAANAGKPEVGALVLGGPFGELARRVMKLWYTGSWYGPYDAVHQTADMERVVSSQAYTNGLVWKAAQAHPMGFSVLRFGYWNGPPPPLSAYTGHDAAGPDSPDSTITVVPIGGPDHA